jgi:hypothetical protein
LRGIRLMGFAAHAGSFEGRRSALTSSNDRPSLSSFAA